MEKSEIPTTAPTLSTEEQEKLRYFNEEFLNWREQLKQSFDVLGNKTLFEYWEKSEELFNKTIGEKVIDAEWASASHNPIITNKLLNIAGRNIQNLPIGRVRPIGTGNFKKADIANHIYKAVEKPTPYRNFMSDMIFASMIDGTAIGYEGYRVRHRKIREKKGKKVVEKVVKEYALVSEIIPVQNFVPSSVVANSIEDLDGGAYVETMSYEAFQEIYGKLYERAKDVVPTGQVDKLEQLGINKYINKELQPGFVEVVHMYHRVRDEYVVLANGYWINPVNDNLDVEPIPFKHKELPFLLMKNEPIAPNFLYGRSLPDKLGYNSKILDTIINMLIDQSIASIYSIWLVAKDLNLSDTELEPNKLIPVDSFDGNLANKIQELKPSTPNGWHQFMVSFIKRILEESSVDQVASGIAGVGGRTTAKEIEEASKGLISTFTYLTVYLKDLATRKTKLRILNAIDLFINKKKPMNLKLLKSLGKDIVNVFDISGVKLTQSADGGSTFGRRIVEVYKSKSKLPSPDELNLKTAKEIIDSGMETEIIAIPADYFREMFEFDVYVETDDRFDNNSMEEQSRQAFKTQLYMQLGADLVNRKQLLANLMRAYNDNPDDLLVSDKQKGKDMPPSNKMVGTPGGMIGVENSQAVPPKMPM